jgi:predicted CoA-binding protein
MLLTDPADLRDLLERVRTIAVVGLSDNPSRDSHEVATYLATRGYRILPVNPACDRVLGQPCYPDMLSLPERPDLIDVFRKPDAVPAIVEEAIAIGAPAIWLQLGVVHADAARRAVAAGIDVVMDHCILIEHRRLFCD